MSRNKTLKSAFALILVSLVFFLGYLVYLQLQPRDSVVPEGFRPLAEGFNSHGIDVSHYQGKIDWNHLFEETDTLISFVFCKTTEGSTLVDSHWKRNSKTLRKLGIPLGAYHYFKPKVPAKEQAKFFLKQYQFEQNDLPPVLDIEEEQFNKKELINNAKIWLDYVENKTGKRPIIYTNYSMFITIFDTEFPDHKFWIASYSDKSERMNDPRILYWQYTDHGKIPGIDGFVDLNMSKVKF